MEFIRFIFGINMDTDYGESFLSGPGIWISVVVIALVLSLLAAICLSNRKNVYNVMSLAFAAICLAASFGLSYWQPVQLPQGGGITICSMLPICLYAYIFGFRRGLLAGFVYSMLQIIQKPIILNLVQTLLDYTLAFSCIAISGLAPAFSKRLKKRITADSRTETTDLQKKSGNLFTSSGSAVCAFLSKFDFSVSLIFVASIRYLCHVLSGIIYFGAYAGAGYSAIGWSFLYNLFVFADIAICIVPAVLLQLSPQFMRYVTRVRLSLTQREKIERQVEKSDDAL